jgi:L-alanine-DL-glutamate epimerase-like enolase superfamily enzyme
MPQPLKLPFWGGERVILKRDAMLIRATADNGLKGYAPGPAHERAANEINGEIKTFLMGKDVRQWERFSFQSLPETVNTYQAVEIALLDLVARYEGCPVSELIGGRIRNNIKLYGSAGMYMAPEKYAEEAAGISALGFSAYKMRPGIGPKNDLLTIELMRKATGTAFGLMVDAHTWWRMGDRSYDYETIVQLISDMAIYDPLWLEEPLPPDDHDAYRRLYTQSKIKLASGEHEPSMVGFQDLINSKSVDFIQMDILCQGGFKRATDVFKEVQKQDLIFAFHSWGTTLEVLTAAHIGICWPENVVEWLEYPCYADKGRPGMYPFPLANDILKESPEITNGYLSVPNEPGLGIEINENVIEKYPFIPGPWSIFHLDSPPETISVSGDHSIKWIDRGNI